MKTLKLIGSAIAATILMTGSVMAATQGSLTEGTSEATSDITLTIPKLVKITDVKDVNFLLDAEHSNTGVLEADTTKRVCVYSNHATTKYKVTFDCTKGSGPTACSTNYFLSDGTNDIVYSVLWENGITGRAGASVAFGDVKQGDNADNVDEDCNGTGSVVDSASFAITITKTELQKAPAGVYQGTLHIKVYPDPA